MAKRKERERKNKPSFRGLQIWLDAHLSYLWVKELEFDRKMRREALTLARKRKVNYIA